MKLLIAISVGAVVAIIVGVIAVGHYSAIELEETRYTEEAYWQERIHVVGSVDAYQELRAAAHTLDPSDQHLLGHIFGSALYTHDPQKGLLECGTHLARGCMHEFVGRSISDGGLTVIKDLNKTCTRINDIGGCQHGIGHGLVGYLGYDEDAFQQSIALCESLENADAFHGCQAGVFMEYNSRTILAVTNNVPPRTLVNNDWYSPCEGLSGHTKEACALWRTQWWNELMLLEGIPLQERVQRGFLLCENDDYDVRDFCFAGMGRVAVQGDPADSAQRAVSICEDASPVRREQLICRAFAVSVVISTLGFDAAYGMCSDLKDEEYVYCHAFEVGEKTEADIVSYQPPAY
ncbi:MAG: hypothetical protein ACJKTH_03495 [Patescibacteria group bacterium UBA2163]